MSTPQEIDPTFVTSATENIVFRKWSAVAVLVLLVWDYALMIQTEIHYIWRRPMSIVKAIYLFARYYGLAVQSVNLYLVLGPLSSLDIAEPICKRWFLFLIASGCALIEAVDAILMLRVYALYLQDLRTGIFLAVLFGAQLLIEGIYMPATVFERSFDPICDSRKVPKGAVYFFITIWVTHLTLLALTLAKRNLPALSTPVVRLVRREGMWIAVLICALFTAAVNYTFIKQVFKAHIVFGWPISIYSVTCCRMIMNMLQLKITSGEGTDESAPTTLSTEYDTFMLQTIDSYR